MLTIRIMAFLLVVLAASAAFSKEYQKVKPTETKEATKSEQRGSDTNPVTVKIHPATDAESKAAQEEKYRNEKTIQDEKLTNATVLLACITGILAFFTGGLWWATYRLSSDAKKTATQQAADMQTSLRIAQESANASNKMATTMTATAERQAEEMQASLTIAKQTAEAALKTAQHMEVSDRAYIKISHDPHVRNNRPSLRVDAFYHPRRRELKRGCRIDFAVGLPQRIVEDFRHQSDG